MHVSSLFMSKTSTVDAGLKKLHECISKKQLCEKRCGISLYSILFWFKADSPIFPCIRGCFSFFFFLHVYYTSNRNITRRHPCMNTLPGFAAFKAHRYWRFPGDLRAWKGEKKISRSGKEAKDCGHVGPRLTGGARLSQLRALDLQADEKGPSLIKLK